MTNSMAFIGARLGRVFEGSTAVNFSLCGRMPKINNAMPKNSQSGAVLSTEETLK